MLNKIIKKFTREFTEEKTNDLMNKLWKTKVESPVEFKDGEIGVRYEDGTVKRGSKFIVEELARQRNRDILIQRGLICVGTFVVAGKTYQMLEKVVKK